MTPPVRRRSKAISVVEKWSNFYRKCLKCRCGILEWNTESFLHPLQPHSPVTQIKGHPMARLTGGRLMELTFNQSNLQSLWAANAAHVSLQTAIFSQVLYKADRVCATWRVGTVCAVYIIKQMRETNLTKQTPNLIKFKTLLVLLMHLCTPAPHHLCMYTTVYCNVERDFHWKSGRYEDQRLITPTIRRQMSVRC